MDTVWDLNMFLWLGGFRLVSSVFNGIKEMFSESLEERAVELGLVHARKHCASWTVDGLSYTEKWSPLRSKIFKLEGPDDAEFFLLAVIYKEYVGLQVYYRKHPSSSKDYLLYQFSALTCDGVIHHDQDSFSLPPTRIPHRFGSFEYEEELNKWKRQNSIRGFKDTLNLCFNVRQTKLNDQLQVHFRIWKAGCPKPAPCSHSIMEPSDSEQADQRMVLSFEKWHRSGKMTDMSIKVGDREFPVHKIVLATHSPVFEAMFEPEWVEMQTDCLDLKTTCEPEVFEKFLEYMYTGRVEGLIGFARDLLMLADKYQIDHLKSICVNSLITSITPLNAADLFNAADLYRDHRLKNKAVTIIRNHLSTVMKSEGWHSLVTTNPAVASQITRSLLNV
ncbi:hypothetical protein GE061_005782 [Apolygus lucorum]|uniref:BTB domain-containing protein n=1 Tax=Apolygus lucorum TaxID=248454 RepID=A0A8S9WYM9_APOLU|nr:hypothetical protein GE061_005782 [Apolygus lucorum]